MKKWLKKDSTLRVKNNVVCIMNGVYSMNGGISYIYIDGSPVIDGEYYAETYKKLGKWERTGNNYDVPEFKEEKLISAFDSSIVKKALSFTDSKKSSRETCFMLAFTEKSIRSTNCHIAYLSDCKDIENMPTMIVDARSLPSRFESVELYETYLKVNVKEQNVDYYIPYTELNYVDFTKIVDITKPIDKKLDISKARHDFDFLAKEAKIKDKRKEENPYNFALDSEHSYDVRYLDILQKAGFEELNTSNECTNDTAFRGDEIALIARRRN
jgi:hypothetical protein